MKAVNVKDNVNPNYIPLFQTTKREAIVYGGAGAGKSYASAQKVILYCLLYKDKKILVMRKTYPALKLTSLELITNLLSKYNIPFELNRADLILNTINNNRMIFKSLDDPEKIKSITDVDLIWFEEPTEISEKEYEMVNLRLRGRELPEGEFRQIILTFNPIDVNHWLYKRFFEKENDAFKQKYTYKDNRFIDKEYIKVLEGLKEKDEYAYQVYCLGEWGVLKGQIYSNYVIENFEDKKFDEVIAGIDFGYNNPTAYVLVGISDNEIYVFDEIYRTQLTTPEIIELVKMKNKEWNVNPTIYCETEPDRYNEMSKAGLRVKEAKKDVIPGINFLKTKKIHIHPRCINFIKEIQGYKYKEDRNGNILEEPVKFNDHLMDAVRYAVYTHYFQEKPNIYFLEDKNKWLY